MQNDINKNDIIQFIENIPSNVEIIDDFIDNKLSYVDYLDTIEELVKPLKAIRNIYGFAKKQRFKTFLKSISTQINETNFVDINNVNKLQKYVLNDTNVDFIINTIDNSINSKSIKCSSLLGIYAGDILNKYKSIDYIDLQIIDILKNINDIELKVFKEFVQKTLNIDEDYYVPSDILNNDNVEETFLIFNKFEYYQMISRPNHSTVRDIDGQPTAFKVSYIGKKLYNLLEKTNIL